MPLYSISQDFLARVFALPGFRPEIQRKLYYVDVRCTLLGSTLQHEEAHRFLTLVSTHFGAVGKGMVY
ncbi:hypothetical protein RB195_012778 [Necator americanus]|uniref:Uncharacterized protein n=1 Tax=Necator americanus TaxID=51031 RepID=A0ABR1DSK5_NECAM